MRARRTSRPGVYPAMRAAFAAVFAGMTPTQKPEQRDRVALILTV
jgi:hypothetical protein